MNIKILGTGCANCKKLESNAKLAVEKTGVTAEIQKVEDIKDIMSFGVMRTPAIVVEGKVKSFGKVSSVDDIVKYIEEAK